MGRGKELAKNTGIIAMGKLSTQLISFLLLPLYTSILTTSEYGIVDLFTTYVQLLLPVATLMISQGAFRYLVDSKNDSERKKILTNAVAVIVVLLFFTTIVFCGIFLFWPNKYKIYLLVVLITAALSDFVMQIARGFRKLHLYAVGGVITSTIQIILNIFFIAVLKLGPQGIFLATIIGNCSCLLVIGGRLKLYKYLELSSLSRGAIKDMFRYSIPLIPNQLSFWIVNSSDRSIVKLFLGLEANGLLAVAHKFPNIFASLFHVFQLSWHEVGTVHFDDSDRDEFFSEAFHKVFLLFASLCIGIIAFLPLVFDLLVNQQYESAYTIIPIYMVAALINMVVGFLGVIYVATKKTLEISKTTIIAGVVNVVIHMALVNHIGLYAAAVSTLVSYLTVMIYRLYDTRKYVKIRFDIKSLSYTAITLFVVIGTYYSKQIISQVIGAICAVVFALTANRDTILQLFMECRRFIKKD